MHGSNLEGGRTRLSRRLAQRPRPRRTKRVLALGAILGVGGIVASMIPALAGGAGPVVPVIPSSTEFDVTGIIQSATANNPADAHAGGMVTVNGRSIVIPAETVVILPAAALTWSELWQKAPAPYAGTAYSGLALSDIPAPLSSYEIHVVGNRVVDPSGTNGCTDAAGCDRYIAGMVNISQQSLNSGAGYINYIDYANGVMYVGGRMAADPLTGSPVLTSTANKGTKVAINDPIIGGVTGRYSSGAPTSGGAAIVQDVRFQVDQDNPTILAETGFPMCLPRTRVDQGLDDPLCPQANRPIMSANGDSSGITPNPNPIIANQPYELFRMDAPGATACFNPNGTSRPCRDPRQQAPFEVGDYVTFAGSIQADPAGGQLVSAHTISASVGIYTQPGMDPAYVSVDVSLIGTGGLTVFGAGEAAVRTRFEGMSTDETRLVTLYGVDINPQTGATTDREWGSALPDLGPPTGAVRGRWRFRPPCTATLGTLTPGKGCTPPLGGTFLPPTREVRAVIQPNPNNANGAVPLSQFLPGSTTVNPNSQVPGTASAKTSANGLYYGQYHAPIGEYIFPENTPGTVVPENNFNTIPFLAYGGYQSGTGVQAGVLNPWPSNVLPQPVVCASPTMNGAPYSVANGSSIQLSGSITAGATLPVSVQWTAGTTVGGTDLNGALTGANTTTPTFNATGLAAATYNVRLTTSNVCGAVSVDNTITVTGAPPPTISPIQTVNATIGTPVTISASSASLPAPTWAWGVPAGLAASFTQNPTPATASGTSSVRFNPTTSGTYTVTVQATNANGPSSVVNVSVVVSAATATNITFTTLQYRTSKQRLDITASSTDLTITGMKLQPYLTETGTTFDPATLGANLVVSLVAPGSYTMTLVGAPPPACNLGGVYATPCAQKPIVVTSIGGAFAGTSAPTALLNIRT